MNKKRLHEILQNVFDEYLDEEYGIKLDIPQIELLIEDIIEKLDEYFELDEEI